MTELSFWQSIIVLAPPFIGIWLVYKLAMIPIWWLELQNLLKNGATAVLGGIVLPVVVLWITAGPQWAIPYFVAFSGLDAAVYATVVTRRKRRQARNLKFIQSISEEDEAEYPFSFFHQQ